MAGNEWIHGYMEAILDGGPTQQDKKILSNSDAVEDVEEHVNGEGRGGGLAFAFNPARYFIDEVVRTDETELHHFWVKVTATKNAEERNNRLENLCWRIWHISRAKKKIAYAQKKTKQQRRIERESGRRDAAEDLSEDLSEGEKIYDPAIGGLSMKLSESHFNLQLLGEPHVQKEKRLYIVMISLHGLVRGENMELGRDSDTGGQVKYVVEFARALARMPEVYRVDLLTRQICCKGVDSSYGEPTEMLSSEDDDIGESGGAYIVRIPCGNKEKYIQKELLWPHIQEFVDGALAHILNISKVLGEVLGEGRPIWPYVIHGHYADAGDVACLLSGALNVPMVFTGHSLGRNKLEQLIKQGRESMESINSTYKIMRRIEAEELCLDSAELLVTSTRQEIEEQWGLYDGFDPTLYRKLRLRAKRGLGSYGLCMPRMAVIPPGMDFSNVIIPEENADGESDSAQLAESPWWGEIMRFLNNPSKPLILALARPDPKKNITTLVKAFGESSKLRKLANLMLVMGNRDDIDQMSAGSANVLTTVLKLIDKYDLYGEVAYPKHHKQSDVADIYRFAARTKGVFINPALVEPFGLTLIEAAAHGLPMVATKNGGPVDIERTLTNGLLVDPHDEKDIASALYKLVADKNLWSKCRKNALDNIYLYSWPQHCKLYLSKVSQCRMRHPHWQSENNPDEDVESEFGSDSIKDTYDSSLRLSIDLDRPSVDLQKQDSGNDALPEEVKKIVELYKAKQRNKQENAQDTSEENCTIDRKSGASTPGKLLLRKRKRLFVIAVDDYDENGEPDAAKMAAMIQDLIHAVRSSSKFPSPGFILSTALTVSETLSMLRAGAIKLSTVDALICSSGSELYYTAGKNFDTPLIPDQDYSSHINYRWGEQGLKRSMKKLAQLHNPPFIAEDSNRCNSHCLAFKVENPSTAMKADELRQKLRMRGLRCHVVYCKNSTRLHLLPLHASRAQALRYFYVRWGLDLGNMYIFVGEKGDTDLEEMMGGLHKTIILQGLVKNGSEKSGRSPTSYGPEDVISSSSSNIVHVPTSSDNGEVKLQNLKDSLTKLA